MPKFAYKARNQAGVSVTGYAEADSLERLKEGLRARGLWLTEAKIKTNIWEKLTKEFTGRVKPTELAMFTKQMAVMLNSGVTLINALSTIQEGASPNFKIVLQKIIEDVKSGNTYANALSAFPRVFSPFFVGMIEVGEAGGLLAEMHDKLTSHLEQSIDLKNKLLLASMYPAMIFFATVAGISIILIYAFPKIADIYNKNKVPLPLITRFLIAVSDFLVHQWYIPLMIIAGLAYLFFGIQVHKKPPLKEWLDGIVIKIPLYGNLYRQISISRFAHNLAMLLNSGIPLLKALEIIRTLLNNVVVQGYLRKIMISVQEGEGMSGYLKTNKFFPPVLVSLIRAGEQSGELADMMLKASRFYEDEVENGVKRFTTLMEPLLIIFAAGSVFIVLLGFYLPMFQMFKVLRH